MRIYPWIKDQKIAAIAVAVMSILAGVGMAQPLAAAFCGLVLPLIGAMTGPAAGLAAVASGALLPQVSLWMLKAPMTLHLALGGYALCIVLPALWAFSGSRSFFKALAVQLAATALGLCLVLMGLRSLLGANLFEGAAHWIVTSVVSLPQGDQVLLQALESGLAKAPGHMLVNNSLTASFRAAPLMTPALRHELTASLQTAVERELYAQLPGGLIAAIVLGALAALCVPVCWLKKQGLKPALQMPAFETWHLPRGWGRWAAALMAGYLLQLMAGSYLELYWGGLMVSAFQWIYLIQGAAYWEYAHKRMGGTRMGRRMFVVLVTLFIPFLLMFFGIIDQRADKRGLREKTQED